MLLVVCKLQCLLWPVPRLRPVMTPVMCAERITHAGGYHIFISLASDRAVQHCLLQHTTASRFPVQDRRRQAAHARPHAAVTAKRVEGRGGCCAAGGGAAPGSCRKSGERS